VVSPDPPFPDIALGRPQGLVMVSRGVDLATITLLAAVTAAAMGGLSFLITRSTPGSVSARKGRPKLEPAQKRPS
jgi:hypothetical protein